MASSIVRTTLNIDDPVLRALKRRASAEGMSVSRLASILPATAMKGRGAVARKRGALRWTARDMRASVDISDRLAVIDTNDA